MYFHKGRRTRGAEQFDMTNATYGHAIPVPGSVDGGKRHFAPSHELRNVGCWRSLHPQTYKPYRTVVEPPAVVVPVGLITDCRPQSLSSSSNHGSTQSDCREARKFIVDSGVGLRNHGSGSGTDRTVHSGEGLGNWCFRKCRNHAHYRPSVLGRIVDIAHQDYPVIAGISI